MVLGAFVAVIADELGSRHAGFAIAGVAIGTRIAILARVGCSLVFATFARFAVVVCTDVVVIAVDCPTADTRAGDTLIRCRAQIVVITGCCVWCVDTAGRMTAGIVRTRVSVIALERSTRGALSVKALVARRANIAVGAGLVVVCMGAALIEVAGVVCAGVAIITDGVCGACASPTATGVSCRTFVAVVARERVGGILTSFFWIA